MIDTESFTVVFARRLDLYFIFAGPGFGAAGRSLPSSAESDSSRRVFARASLSPAGSPSTSDLGKFLLFCVSLSELVP